VQKRLLMTVGANDINDQRIELTEGGRVSGSVTVNGSAPPAFGVGVTAGQAGTGVEALFASHAWAKRDGTFMVEAVTPGEVYLDVTLPRGKGHYVRSVTADGVDLLRAPLRVADGAESAGVRIDLGSDPAAVSGRVLNADDRSPTAGAVVMLVSADEGLWRSKASRAFARADAAGEFSAEAAPGHYLLFVWRPGEEPAGPFEAYLRSRAASARRVALKPGANPKLELLATPPPRDERRQ
jgi:hypothetical protein